jgi:uncharacterized protein YegP (UPF0339 family)
MMAHKLLVTAQAKNGIASIRSNLAQHAVSDRGQA